MLTPVLSDAITACHALGLRYLWIDSLCIQQDGGSADWEEQSQEMSHIFGNSWLTICAPASNSCLEGFLDHIDRHSGAIQIEYVTKRSGRPQGSFFLRLFTINGKLGPYRDDRAGKLAPLPVVRDLEYSKWNTRGWVFQERNLSPRLLYFGARMIHFQHGDRVISEDGSSVDGDFFDHTFVSFRHCSTNLLHQLEEIQSQGPFITDLWYRLITVISPSHFTDRRVTFPAIAGVARRVCEFNKHRYVAGLWEEDLCCGLLWAPRVTYHDLQPRRTPASLRQLLQSIKKATNSIAPSWSWASRRSCLKFLATNRTNTTCRVRRHLRAESKILQSRVLVDGVSPYGRIRSASISLSGSTIRMAPGLLASMHSDHFDPQLCELFPDLFAFIERDWTPIVSSRATGVKRQKRALFQLLLIASCCSEPEAEPLHRSRARVLSGKDVTPEEKEKMIVEAMKSQYRRSFYEDSPPWL